jgi:hypothetical protein
MLSASDRFGDTARVVSLPSQIVYNHPGHEITALFQGNDARLNN